MATSRKSQVNVMPSTAMNHNLTLTVPSTQNTAPVLDFRCLYTHDLRRKAKRWQDGFLRFHTFNKRIMVYDLSKNFIGDCHWREKDALQDGDELELEKGVLIQVGESTGSTIQDLSGLFEKRRNVQLSSPAKESSGKLTPGSPARSVAAQPSQLRPKSLNAVLGTLKGPLGRTTVPFKSPCQLRREKENAHTDEARPVKRQRVEVQTTKVALPGTLARVKPVAPTIPSPKGLGLSEDSRQVIEKMTVTEFSDPALPRRLTTATKTAGVKLNPNLAFNQHDATRAISASKSTLKTPKSPKSRSSERATQETIITCLGEREEPQNVNVERKIQMQIIARKPRKKLMYRDFLPQTASSARPSAGSQNSRSNTVEDTEAREPKIDRRVKHHQAEKERIKARLKRIDEKEQRKLDAIKPLDSVYPPDSEVDEVVFVPSSPEQTRKKKPPNNLQFHSKLSGHRIWIEPVQEERYRTDPILPDLIIRPQTRIPPTQPPFEPLIRSSSPPPAATDSIISIPATPPPQDPSPQTRRRVRSLPFSKNSAPCRRKRSPLRKTASDTAKVPAPEPDQKPDPWSREAWDLFGCGRPEKKKGD